MPRVTTMKKTQRHVAGVLLGLLATALPAHANVETAERAAVVGLLAERQSSDAISSLPSSSQEETAEIGRLLATPLTVDTAVRLALINHRGVRAALLALGVPRGQLLQASLPPNPEIEISLRAPHDTTQPLQAEIGVDYDISALILLPLRRSVAKTELSAARQRAAAEVLEVVYQARLAFYDVAARGELRDLRQRAFQTAEAAYAIRDELAAAGNARALDLHQERAAMESARLAVIEADLALREARERLNSALGLVGAQTGWSLAAVSLPAPAAALIPDAEQRVIRANFDLAALRGQALAAEGRARMQRAAGVLPHLGAGFHGEHDGAVWELGGHVSLSLPLINQGQGRVAAARAEAGSLRARLVAMETSLRARVRTVEARLSLNLARVQTLREGVLPARERALRETQLQYNGMQVSAFQLLDSRRQLFDAQAAYVDALREAQVARAALDLLLAGHSAELSSSAARIATGEGGAAAAGH